VERNGGPTAGGIEPNGGDRGHYGSADTRGIIFVHDAGEGFESGDINAAILDEHFDGAGAEDFLGDAEPRLGEWWNISDDFRQQLSAGHDGALRK
jgi:hypothetical protein